MTSRPSELQLNRRQRFRELLRLSRLTDAHSVDEFRDPTTWKLSDMDLKSYSRWFDYSRARDETFLATDTSWAPWFVTRSENKRRARLNALTHILSKIPYEERPRSKVKLPKRQERGDYKESDYPFRVIAEVL